MADELEHRNGEPVIITPVATILSQIQTEQASGFARVEKSLEGKADKGDMIELRTTVREHADRLSSLERDRRTKIEGDEHRFTRRQAFWGIVLGIGIIMSTLGAALISVAVK